MKHKLDLLERDIRNNCSPTHWYTHLLLIRLQEDRLLVRKPALFYSWGAHWVRHLLPFATADVALTWLAWRHGSQPNGPTLALSALLLGVGMVLAQIDWEQLRQVRNQLRLPALWDEYPQRPRRLREL